MSFHDVVAASLAAMLATACVHHTGPEGGRVRGIGAGWESEPQVRSPQLTDRGATVRVVDSPSPGCTHIGYVTGVAKRPRPRQVGLSRAEWEATLPWTEADDDARNLAGAHGARELVIDAHETQERRSESEGTLSFRTYLLVHSRAFACAGTKLGGRDGGTGSDRGDAGAARP
jgi:hypothetical protein